MSWQGLCKDQSLAKIASRVLSLPCRSASSGTCLVYLCSHPHQEAKSSYRHVTVEKLVASRFNLQLFGTPSTSTSNVRHATTTTTSTTKVESEKETDTRPSLRDRGSQNTKSCCLKSVFTFSQNRLQYKKETSDAV